MARALAPGLVAVLVAIGFAAGFAALVGADPGLAAEALVGGALGSTANLTDTLVKTTPLLLTGAAVMVAFESGLFNIGAEGQFLIGALAATAVGTRPAPAAVHLVAVLAAGALGGAFLALIAGALRIRRGVSEVISTILLNFLALYLVSYAVHGPLAEASGRYPQSDALVGSATLPKILGSTRLHGGVPLAFVMVALAGLVMRRTSLGLRLRAAGLNARAAELAGFPVGRDLAVAFALSGALAGLGGAVEVAGVTGRLYERISPGYGYAAIAVALLGGLRTPGVIAAALFFAALAAGASAMERTAGVSSVLVVAVQGATLLAIAVLNSGVLQKICYARPALEAGTPEDASRAA